MNCVAKEEGFTIEKLYFTLLNDESLQQINIKYLKHNTLTDIITFDYGDHNIVSGEVFISIDRVKDNALQYKVSYKKEFLRVLVHGLLHLCGYGDKTAKEQKLMREKENYYINKF